MSPEVFISHSSRDHDHALRLREALTSHGVRCWIAPEDIRYGKDFPQEISRALGECKILVLLASPPVNESEYIKDEVFTSYENKLKRYRVNLTTDLDLDDNLDFWLRRSQWVNAYEMPDEEWYRRLVSSILQDLNLIEEDIPDLRGGTSRLPRFSSIPDAMKAAGRWQYAVPLGWWLVCGVLPTATLLGEFGVGMGPGGREATGSFLAKLWPHFFVYPILIGFLAPICLIAPVRYLREIGALKAPLLAFIAVAAAYFTYSDVAAGDPALWEYDRIEVLQLVPVSDSTAEVMLLGNEPRGAAGTPQRVMDVAHANIRCPEVDLLGDPTERAVSPECAASRSQLKSGMEGWRDGQLKTWSATHWAYVIALFVHVFTLGLAIACVTMLLRLRLQGTVREPALYSLMALTFSTYFLWLPFRIVCLHEKANLFGESTILTELPITMVVILCYGITGYLAVTSVKSIPIYLLLAVAGGAMLYVALAYPQMLFYLIGRSSNPLTYPMITLALLAIIWPLLSGKRTLEVNSRRTQSGGP